MTAALTDVFHVSGQVEWRDEVRHHFEKIKSEGTCLHRLDEELIKRRREELRLAEENSDEQTATQIIREELE